MSDVLTEDTRQTRKPHRCHGCAKLYPPKTRMTYVKTVDAGDFTTTYWCTTCNEFQKGLPYWDREDGFLMGELLEYDDYPIEAAL